MSKISGLESWLLRRDPLDGFAFECRIPDRDSGCFVGIDVTLPVHESVDLQAEGLAESWEAVQTYMGEALRIIDADEPLWLDREEVEMIKDDLGDPPSVAYPLYFISVGEGEKEQLVYVGKTSSKNSRFAGGHPAITKLHAPEYEGQSKTLYMGTLFFLDNFGYLPIEWIRPLEKAEQLLKSVEAQIIYEYKPKLNLEHVNKFNSKWPTPINFENFSDRKNFLDGEMSFGPTGEGVLPRIWSREEIDNAVTKWQR